MMTPLLAVLSLLAPQEPQGRAATHLDVIVMHNGETFEGRVLTELDDYVEFEIETGSVVGVGKKQVKEIRRGGGARFAPVAAAVAPRDEWFVLHDARGAAVGWLHATVGIAGDGTVTAAEEYEFLDGKRRYQVTSQCTADKDLSPIGCYFRERISEPLLAHSTIPGLEGLGRSDRIVGERIVDARCQDGQLVVIRADGSGRRERSYDWAPDGTFPLLARVAARATGAQIEDVPMFDPASEEIGRRSVAGRRLRAMTVDGQTQKVTELVESGVNTKNSVWLDASMRTVRREIAGPALVAVPSDAQSARGRVGRATIPAALAGEAGGQFGLWIPNPAWRAQPDLDAGQVALVCDAHGASISLTRLDHLEAETAAPMAAEAVANWFRLLNPELRLVGREHVLVRDRRATRLIADGRKAGNPERATIDVIPHQGHFLVLVCRASRTAWDELANDFAFVLRTAELEPQSVEPPLSGPLLRQQNQGAGGRQPAKPAVKPTGQPTVDPAGASPRRELPNVRIPLGGQDG